MAVKIDITEINQLRFLSILSVASFCPTKRYFTSSETGNLLLLAKKWQQQQEQKQHK